MTEQAAAEGVGKSVAEGVGGAMTTVGGDGGRVALGRYRRHTLPAR